MNLEKAFSWELQFIEYKYLRVYRSNLYQLIRLTSYYFFSLLMGKIKLIQEKLLVFNLLLSCFRPLIHFLYFELISLLINKNYDDDSGSGINISAFQAKIYLVK